MAIILVVEDDLTLVRSIVRNLTVRGYGTISAGSIAAAMQALEEDCPDLLLLDIDLPDGSGWEILRLLRAGICVDAAVIVISALRPNARLASEFRCVAVLEKPFPMESLLRLVSKSLDHLEGRTLHDAATEKRKSHE